MQHPYIFLMSLLCRFQFWLPNIYICIWKWLKTGQDTEKYNELLYWGTALSIFSFVFQTFCKVLVLSWWSRKENRASYRFTYTWVFRLWVVCEVFPLGRRPAGCSLISNFLWSAELVLLVSHSHFWFHIKMEKDFYSSPLPTMPNSLAIQWRPCLVRQMFSGLRSRSGAVCWLFPPI